MPAATSPMPDRPRGSGRSRRLAATGLGLMLLAAAALGCSRQRPSNGPAEAPPKPSPQELAAQQCRQRRDALQSQLRELRQAETDLARLRRAPMPPTPGRPVWDEEKEQRYSQEDQEIDRQAYLRDLDAWRLEDDARWAAWLQRQTPEIAQKQRRLNQLSQALHAQHPQLFTGPSSIEVKPAELARLSSCEALPG